MGGALPAALSSLHEWAGGRTIETLAGGLRLSHSRTVRVVDRLEQRGLARRARDPGDGRSVLVHLTPAGRRAAAACSTRARRRSRRRSQGSTAASSRRSPSGCWAGRRAAGAPPGRTAGSATRTRAGTMKGAAPSRAPRTPPRPRPRRASGGSWRLGRLARDAERRALKGVGAGTPRQVQYVGETGIGGRPRRSATTKTSGAALDRRGTRRCGRCTPETSSDRAIRRPISTLWWRRGTEPPSQCRR